MKRYPLQDWRREWSDYFAGSDAFDPARFEQIARIARYFADYFKAELHGSEHIPREGGALIVSNHGPWGIDTPALLYRLWEHTRRVPRPLAEHLLIKLPFIGRLFREVGAVDGRPENAVKLLEDGQLVVVYPGGHHESLKPVDQSYQLRWERARGYLKCAIRTGVPIVPIAGIGIDEAFLTVGHERWLGRLFFGREDYDLPITLGFGLIPFPVRFTFTVGAPLELGVPPEAADDEAEVERLHARVVEATQGLIDRERSRRRRPVSD